VFCSIFGIIFYIFLKVLIFFQTQFFVAEEIRIETNKLEIEAWKYLIHQPSDYEVRKNKQKMPHVSPYWRFSSAFMLLYFILMMTCINSWTMMEGNHVMYITDGCRGEMLDTDTEKREAIISDMILYMNNFHKRKNYLGRYILCNIFTLTVLIGITAFYMYLFEWFFDANEGGGYSPLQLIRWTKADNSYRDDPLIRLFPRNMGCDMEYYGPSGTREFKEFKCESPYNNANEFINVAALFLMPVLVFAIILNMIYTILCVVCLTTTCCQNTRFRTAADPLNNDQRFLLLLVCKNVGYDVQTLLLQKLSTIMTQKTKKTKSTEAATDNLNF